MDKGYCAKCDWLGILNQNDLCPACELEELDEQQCSLPDMEIPEAQPRDSPSDWPDMPWALAERPETPSLPVTPEEPAPDELPRLGDISAQRRLNARMFLLTYPQSGALTKQSVYNMLMSRGVAKRLIVGQETHANGDPHIHALVEYERKKDVTTKYFDLGGKHPNISTHKSGDYLQSLINCWNYCQKEDREPITFGEKPESRKRKRNECFDKAIDLAVTHSVREAMDHLLKVASYDALTKYDQIERALHKVRAAKVNVAAPALPMSAFKNPPPLNPNWRNLFLFGPSGTGKTSLARALLPKAAVIRHRNQLVDADFSHGLIFDDFEISHWPPTAGIHLLDWEQGSGIDVKHGYVVIPPRTRKIFTYNLNFYAFCPKEASAEQMTAMERRIEIIRIDDKLFE